MAKKTKEDQEKDTGTNIEVKNKKTAPAVPKRQKIKSKLSKIKKNRKPAKTDKSDNSSLDKTKTIEQALKNSETKKQDPDIGEMPDGYEDIEDDLLEEAASKIDEANSPKKEPKAHKKEKNGKKWFYRLLILTLLATASAGAWYYFTNMKDKNNSEPLVAQEQQQEPVKSYTPDTIIYSYHLTEYEPITIYSRPASGGDRKEILKLEKDEDVISGDAVGQTVAFLTNNGLYASQDGGQKFEKIVDTQSSQELVSLKIAGNEQSIAYGVSGDGSGAKIKKINLSDKNSEDLFETEQSEVHIFAYTQDNNVVIYGERCADCSPEEINITKKGSSDEKLVELGVRSVSPQGNDVTFALNEDLTKAIFINKSPELKRTINTVVLESEEKNELAEITPDDSSVGFITGEDEPFYLSKSLLYTNQDGQQKALIKSKEPLLFVVFAGKDEAIIASGQSINDYKLLHYKLSTDQSSEIFLGDSNAVIFGVTTK